MADDEELLELAAGAGCTGVFIGFESPSAEGLAEVGKKFNLAQGRRLPRQHCSDPAPRHCVVGSFIMGLDSDKPGMGRRIADAAVITAWTSSTPCS